jgi:hypothetical protein
MNELPVSGGAPGDALTRDTETAAPVIGSVRALADPRLAADLRLRSSQVELDGFMLGRFAVAAASIIGLGHALQGGSRQDAYNAALAASGDVYLVVADGLGSKSVSQLGARLFCDATIELALDRTPRTHRDVREVVYGAGRRMADIASAAYGVDPGEVGCVCVMAVVRSEQAILARVGDSSAFILQDGHFDEAFAEGNGYVNVVDASLPTDDQDDVEIVERGLEGGSMALVSDGLAIDLRTSPVLRSWLANCWAQPIGPFAMGESLRYRRQGSHDDRTALALWVQDVEEDLR